MVTPSTLVVQQSIRTPGDRLLQLMEPVSLWTCSCEKVPTKLLALGRQRSRLQLLCRRPSHRFTVGLRSGDRCGLRQHLLTSSPQGRCGLVNGGVAAQFHLCITWHHGTQETKCLSEWPELKNSDLFEDHMSWYWSFWTPKCTLNELQCGVASWSFLSETTYSYIPPSVYSIKPLVTNFLLFLEG